MSDKPAPDNAKMNGNRGIALRNTTLMEYSPGEIPYEEYHALPPEPASFRDYLKILFRQKYVVLATLIVTLLAVYVAYELHTPLYETQVRLLIRAEKVVESPFYRDLDNSFKSEVVLTQAEIAKSNPVLTRVVKALKLDERPLNYERPFASPIKQYVIDLKSRLFKKKMQELESNPGLRFGLAAVQLSQHVKVKPVPNTTLFSITARDFDPEAAAKIANTISHYYVIFDLEQQMAELETKYGEKNVTIRQLREEIQKFEDHLTVAPSSYSDVMGPGSTKILEEASAPMEPVGYPISIILFLAGVCGLCLGVIMAFLFERADPTFRTTDDVQKVLNLAVLGSVPVKKFGAKLLKKSPIFSTRYTRSFQDLADHLSMLMNREGLRSVLVTAHSPGEGTSVVTANLSNYLSKNLGHKILVVDANLRHPVLQKLFKVPEERGGLSDVLQGKLSLENAIYPLNDHLDILPTKIHEGSPLALLNSPGMGEIIQKLGNSYEMVLIDSPSMKDFKDSEVLSTQVNGVVLVIEPGRARRQSVRTSVEQLEQKKVNILGVIFNKRIFHVPQLLYRQV